MDDVLCAFTRRSQQIKSRYPEVAYPQSLYGFFSKLPEIEGAIESLNFLRKCEEFDVYILTAPSVWNPLCYTEKRIWVEEHLGMEMVNKLIISPHKGLNKGDYLIDDHTEGRGQDSFEGTLIHFGSSEFPDWKTVKDYFIKTYLKEEISG